jgi:hypothetical protein
MPGRLVPNGNIDELVDSIHVEWPVNGTTIGPQKEGAASKLHPRIHVIIGT